MLYSYYMKINSKLLAGCLFLGCFVCAQAQVTLVKQDGDKLYLDTSTLNRNVQKGETFKIITSSEMLTNPKTGKQLGQIYHYSKEGKITEIQPLYAVGEIKNAPGFTIGQEAVIEPAPAAEQKTAPAVQPASQAQPLSNRKINRPFTLEQTIISLSAADVTGDGKENLITLSDKGLVTVWNTDTQTPAPLYTWQLKNKTGITLSAADVKHTGRTQIFVTAYHSAKENISTAVLELADNQLTETETLPYFTKELGCGKQKQIWVQRPFVLGTNPGTAHPLVYDGKRFKTAEQRLNTQRSWLTGVNLFTGSPQEEGLLYTAPNGRIRLITAKGKRVESKDLFAATPNRVKYKQDIIKFYPSVQVYKTEGGPAIAAVENISKLGLLSNTFGSYQNSKIHFMRLEKGRLAQTDSVELDGFVYDTACTADKVLTAEVLPDGTSAVVEIFR